MQAGADMVESAFSAGQIGFGYDMGAVAEAENSKVDAGHSLEVRIFVEDASLPETHAGALTHYFQDCLWLRSLTGYETICKSLSPATACIDGAGGGCSCH